MKMQQVGTVKPSVSFANTTYAVIKPRSARTSHTVQAAPKDGLSVSDRMAVGLLGVATAVSLALAPPAFAANGPFLKSTGARGILADEEAELYSLRQKEEAAAREEFNLVKREIEQESRRSPADQFCATPFGIDVVGITEFVALTGALVGGISARRRKDEMERLNEQLRTINTQLRQQARAGTLFAPGLTYAPPSSLPGGAGSTASTDTISSRSNKLSLPSGAVKPMPMPQVTSIPKTAMPAVEAAAAAAAVGTPEASTTNLVSIDDEDVRPEVRQCQAALKEGKKLLKDSAAGPAMVRFEKALMLAKSMGDKVRERRAVRGLAAASRLSNQNRQAIKHLERVLEISKETGDHVGDADAYGVIADIYTDIGEFEKAAEYYDKYISQMNTDGPI
jgi:tetratricopeptide (TPR) repeat protein